MQMQEVDDVFKAMVDVPEPGRGTYINEDGSFLVEVTKAFGKVSQNPLKPGRKFIVEFKIIESNSENNPVGCTRSWVLDWEKTMSQADIKAFSLAAANLRKLIPSKRDADIQATYLAFAAAGPLVAGEASTKAKQLLGAEAGFFDGLRVRLETEKKQTKDGRPFTRYNWFPV